MHEGAIVHFDLNTLQILKSVPMDTDTVADACHVVFGYGWMAAMARHSSGEVPFVQICSTATGKVLGDKVRFGGDRDVLFKLGPPPVTVAAAAPDANKDPPLLLLSSTRGDHEGVVVLYGYYNHQGQRAWQSMSAATLLYDTPVRSVQLARDRLVVLLDTALYVYKI